MCAGLRWRGVSFSRVTWQSTANGSTDPSRCAAACATTRPIRRQRWGLTPTRTYTATQESVETWGGGFLFFSISYVHCLLFFSLTFFCVFSVFFVSLFCVFLWMSFVSVCVFKNLYVHYTLLFLGCVFWVMLCVWVINPSLPSQMPHHPSCHHRRRLLQQCSSSCHGNPTREEHLWASLPHLSEVVSRATGAAGSLPGSSPRQPVPVRPVWPPDADSQQAGGACPRAHGGAAVHLWPLPLQRQAAGQSASALQGQTRRARQRERGGRTRRCAHTPVLRARRQSAFKQTRSAAAHTAQHTHCCSLLLLPSSSSSLALWPGRMEGFVSSPPHHNTHLSETSHSSVSLLFLLLHQTLISLLPWSDNFFINLLCPPLLASSLLFLFPLLLFHPHFFASSSFVLHFSSFDLLSFLFPFPSSIDAMLHLMSSPCFLLSLPFLVTSLLASTSRLPSFSSPLLVSAWRRVSFPGSLSSPPFLSSSSIHPLDC